MRTHVFVRHGRCIPLGMQRFFFMMKYENHDFSGRLAGKLLGVLFILPIVCFLIGLCSGRMAIPPTKVIQAILSKFYLTAEASPQTGTVIWSMRIPRLLLACVVGCGLSIAGCTFQSLFSNPLATPDTLGVASGASFGAALALLLGFRMIGVQLSALVFGIIAVILTSFSGAGLQQSRTTPILAGIMVGSLFNSFVSLIKFTADTESQLPAITYWLMGSLESAGYQTLLLGAPPILICTTILLLLRWKMNLLPLSREEAVSSGVNIERLRWIAQICATLITASCVSMCGQVGWVGLIVPHICRMKYGSNHVALLPASVGIGMSFMMVVDTIARTVSPKEIPISVLTAMIGAPFFIRLLRKDRGWTL